MKRQPKETFRHKTTANPNSSQALRSFLPLLSPDFVIEKHRPELRRIDLRRVIHRPVVPCHWVRRPRRRGPTGLLLQRGHLLHFSHEAYPGPSPTKLGSRRARCRHREAPPANEFIKQRQRDLRNYIRCTLAGPHRFKLVKLAFSLHTQSQYQLHLCPNRSSSLASFSSHHTTTCTRTHIGSRPLY